MCGVRTMRGVLLCAKFLSAFAGALALSGCLPSTGTPDRLYSVAYEMEVVRTTQEDLVGMYNAYVFSAPAHARLIRNEIIAQRMYAIDVQYTQYENALTREGQEVNFGTLATAGALGTASTLFTPVVTKSVLSGLSTVTLATKGHYDSEILLAQTIRTIQKQMRASRNLVATDISAKLIRSVADYPLSAALSDVEDYYNAGTLTTGVIDTSTTVGIKEDNSKAFKQDVTQAPAGERAAIIRAATPPRSTQVVPIVRPSVTNPAAVKPAVESSFGPDDASAALRNWIKLDTANRDKLGTFAAGVKPGLQITTFLDGKEFAAQRRQFAREQGLIR